MDKKREFSIDPKTLDQPITETFSKREWAVIYSIFTRQDYKLGEAAIVLPIIAKIENFLNPDTNISPESAAQQLKEAMEKDDLHGNGLKLATGKKVN